MTAPAETSRFGKNLILQFILGVVLGGLTATMHPPLSFAFGALCALLTWSVTIGIIYALFRLGGTRVDFLGTYYQQTECPELFDSIPGTAMVLVVSIILLVLSLKFDDIKTLTTTPNNGPPS